MKKHCLILAAMLAVGVSLAVMADEDDGHAWLKSAPAFCSSKPYSNLTPKQMSVCDEAAFRYLSKNWETVTASNGQAYEVALDTISRPIIGGGAKLRAASVLVYMYEGEIFNAQNVIQFFFDCHDQFQTLTSDWTPPAYMPPLSIAAKISTIACKHPILRTNQAKLHPITNDNNYDPIPERWNIKIGLPGTISVGAEYCTQSGKCEYVGNDIAGITIGGSPVGGIQGCQELPDAEPCLKARIPVEVLAANHDGGAIVRLHDRNYEVSGMSWYKREPDGSYVGGPVSVIYKGISMPLRIYFEQSQ